MTRVPACIFCRIVAREQPVHVLVVPRKHIATLKDSAPEDEALLGHLLLIAARAARDKGLSGFRTVINTDAEAGQTIFHLHVHVMGGRSMRWPPG
jgi:histidine triad (HIT) family protein